MLFELGQGDVGAVLYVAEESDVAAVQHLMQSVDDAFDTGVVGGYTVADQAEGCGVAVKDVDGYGNITIFDFFTFGEDIGGVDTGRACTDDGDAQGAGCLRHERFLSAPDAGKRGDRLRTFVHRWAPLYRRALMRLTLSADNFLYSHVG